MELEQFVKDALIAIMKGCQEGQTDQTKAGTPACIHEGILQGQPGIEFDLGITYSSGKIVVKGETDKDKSDSRLRFFVPILKK